MFVTELAPVLRSAVRLEHCVDEGFLAQTPLESFSRQGIDFLAALGQRILAHPAVRTRPAWQAMGDELRRARLLRLVALYKSGVEAAMPAPLGVVLHIAPGAVETLFVQSFALSLLAGNLNVVRVSQRLVEPLSFLIGELRTLMQEPEHREIAARNRFLTWPHAAELNRYLARRADVRMIGGSDETVTTFHAMPGPVGAKEISFPDRTSSCAIAARRYLEADEAQARAAAERFFRDAYWFDQRSASSPRNVYFIGDEAACEEASAMFWERLEHVLLAEGWESSAANERAHLAFAYQQLAEERVDCYPSFTAAQPKRLRLSDPAAKPHCGGGMFAEQFLPSLASLVPLTGPSDHTLVYFGFPREELLSLARVLRGRGYSRLVPLGEANPEGAFWDGRDLLRELTRLIVVR